MKRWFWYFFLYSFFGFCLEVLYAKVTNCPKPDRKCFLFLPLCPVYGLGACAILLPSKALGRSLPLLCLWSMFAATAAEYLTALFCEKALGVSFWDYSQLPLNLSGRVCLLFSVFWCVLGVVLVRYVHPLVSALVERIPPFLTPLAVILTLSDLAVTVYLLATTHTTDSLKWYSF